MTSRDNALAPGLWGIAGAVPDAHGEDSPGGGESKKCNCKKSKCLKLYCECFAAGAFCHACSCQSCQNTPGNVVWPSRCPRECERVARHVTDTPCEPSLLDTGVPWRPIPCASPAPCHRPPHRYRATVSVWTHDYIDYLHRLFTSTIYIDCLHRLRVLLATLSTRILNPRFSSSTVSYDVFLTLSALPVAGHVIDTHFEPHFSSPTASYDM
jgi:hypothetical protein